MLLMYNIQQVTTELLKALEGKWRPSFYLKVHFVNLVTKTMIVGIFKY